MLERSKNIMATIQMKGGMSTWTTEKMNSPTLEGMMEGDMRTEMKTSRKIHTMNEILHRREGTTTTSSSMTGEISILHLTMIEGTTRKGGNHKTCSHITKETNQMKGGTLNRPMTLTDHPQCLRTEIGEGVKKDQGRNKN